MSTWREVTDKASGKKYYYNQDTKETRWTKPEESEETGGGGEASLWKEVLDKKSGRSYYYNTATKETTWKKPAAMQGGSASGAASGGIGEADLGDPNDWKEVKDKATGRTYYYNKNTKQTSWKRPKGFGTRAAAEAAASQGNGDEDLPDIAPIKVGGVVPSVGGAMSGGNAPQGHNVLDDLDSVSLTDTRTGSDEDETITMSQIGRQKLLDSDDDEDLDAGNSSKFQFAKHRKGWVNRTFHTGDTHDETQLLSFKKSLIKKSLLKQNRDFDVEAVQSFKNIMSYMGDRRSHKSEVGHAKKLVMNGLAAPESLKDELFLQICKQLTNHPNLAHCIKGWELMSIVLGCFPPSKTMRQFLADFISKAKFDETNDSEIRKLASVCAERLEKISQLGPRSEVPSSDEIKKEQTGSLVSLQVFTLDNSRITIDADCFMLVKEVKRDVIQKLGLLFSAPFSLYEYSKQGDERILEDDSRVLDVVASWERVAAEQNIVEKDPFRLVFKAELVLKTTDKKLLEDDEAINLMYVQAVHDVISERYPPESKDCPSLAALHLQAQFGDYNPQIHTEDWISQRLHELVPNSLITGKKGKKQSMLAAEYAQKILTKYAKLTGVAAQEAQLSYLDYVQDWPLYGASFITVEQKQLKDYPSFIRVAITCDALLLVHPETKDVLDSFGYHEIVTWGYSDEKFILVVGNLVQQRKLFFKTNRGKFMNKLVHDYVKTKVPDS